MLLRGLAWAELSDALAGAAAFFFELLALLGAVFCTARAGAGPFRRAFCFPFAPALLALSALVPPDDVFLDGSPAFGVEFVEPSDFLAGGFFDIGVF